MQQDELRSLMTVCYFFKDTDEQNDFAFALWTLLYRDRYVHQLVHKNCTGDEEECYDELIVLERKY